MNQARKWQRLQKNGVNQHLSLVNCIHVDVTVSKSAPTRGRGRAKMIKNTCRDRPGMLKSGDAGSIMSVSSQESSIGSSVQQVSFCDDIPDVGNMSKNPDDVLWVNN